MHRTSLHHSALWHNYRQIRLSEKIPSAFSKVSSSDQNTDGFRDSDSEVTAVHKRRLDIHGTSNKSIHFREFVVQSTFVMLVNVSLRSCKDASIYSWRLVLPLTLLT